LCAGLHDDFGIKKGQIAHIDGNSSNSDSDNLVYLCLDHHDELDSKTSQSKGLTFEELKEYRRRLYEHYSSPRRTKKKTEAKVTKPSIKVYWKGWDILDNDTVVYDLRDAWRDRPELELDFNVTHELKDKIKLLKFGIITSGFIDEIPDGGNGYPKKTIHPDGRLLFESTKMVIDLMVGSWTKYSFALYFLEHCVDRKEDCSIRLFYASGPVDIPFRVWILGCEPKG